MAGTSLQPLPCGPYAAATSIGLSFVSCRPARCRVLSRHAAVDGPRSHANPLYRVRQTRRRSRGECGCSLTVLREVTLRRLLPSQFTGDQWKYYWGITETDKFGKVYEALTMTFFGLWTSWFLTFLIGLPLATCLGTIFLFYGILAPGLAAYRRNVSFRGAKFARSDDDDGVFGAHFSGRVVRVGRITQKMEYNRPEAFVMSMEDDEGRKLRVYAPLLPSYKRVRPGMRCEGVVLSESPDFDDLVGVSDIFVPACSAWVGDYPYLDKMMFKAFLKDKVRRQRMRKQRDALLPSPQAGTGGIRGLVIEADGTEEPEEALRIPLSAVPREKEFVRLRRDSQER